MQDDHLDLVADIVSAYVRNNSVPLPGLPGMIADVSAALAALSRPAPEPKAELVPAVSPKKSVFPDYIVSLENGKQFRSLKRHLSTLGMTPDEYRAKWGLARDYPMVAASYAAKRSELAKALGLGRKAQPAEAARGAEVEAAEPSSEPAAVTERSRKAAKAAEPAEAPEGAEAPSKPKRTRKKAEASE